MNLRKGALSLAILFDNSHRTFLNINAHQMMVVCEVDVFALPDDLLLVQGALKVYGLEVHAHHDGYTLRRVPSATINKATLAEWEEHLRFMNSLSLIERERHERRLQA